MSVMEFVSLHDIPYIFLSPDSQCYAKATSVGRRFSEGGTHEETLRPQDLIRGLESR